MLNRDRRLNAFEGFDMAEWYLKIEHLDFIKEISKGKNFKVILMYTGLFLEDSLIVRDISRFTILSLIDRLNVHFSHGVSISFRTPCALRSF